MRSGSYEVVKAVLSAGADPDTPGPDGRTALIMSARVGDDAMVDALLEAGADASLASAEDGTTALMWAANGGFGSIVDTLLAAGADVGAVAADGWTAWEAAEQAGHSDLANRLGQKI